MHPYNSEPASVCSQTDGKILDESFDGQIEGTLDAPLLISIQVDQLESTYSANSVCSRDSIQSGTDEQIHDTVDEAPDGATDALQIDDWESMYLDNTDAAATFCSQDSGRLEAFGIDDTGDYLPIDRAFDMIQTDGALEAPELLVSLQIDELEEKKTYLDNLDATSICSQDSVESEMDAEYMQWEQSYIAGGEENVLPSESRNYCEEAHVTTEGPSISKDEHVVNAVAEQHDNGRDMKDSRPEKVLCVRVF